ncbi:sodium-dependent transporter [Marinobacter litoralis]|uniref:sodium-dependent transporter n=1 Tax=Marinobacter litoralis TaxID=187981 RepID=UPI0018ED2CBD|nr:sodium-dependent transporter [Marinobacter litoralis]MBJ6136841.1 sodium-dependent transporter [Marinobacter litoralis]
MSSKYQTSIGSFTRKSTFFWASVGATVGLANLWQFPYLASVHGGGLFVLAYLVCLLVVTLPLMVTEAAIGRHSRHGMVLAMDGLVKTAGGSSVWRLAGPLSILASFLVLSFTAVFGGIVVAYIFFGATDSFGSADTAEATGLLAELVSSSGRYREFMGWHAFFLLLVVWVSARGVVSGVERSLRMIVPGGLVLMFGLFAVAVTQGQLASGIDSILVLRPAQFGLESLQAAFFHAFFTLGLGVGVWAIFGAYSTSHTRLKRSLLAVVLMDTLIAIVVGVMMFSVASGSGSLDGQHGFGLLFVSLPVTLAPAPFSQVVITAVFLAVMLVVWATSIALLESVVAWFREWTGAPRTWSVIIVGAAVWLAGLASLFSFNVWSEYRLAGATTYRWVELVAGGVLIPLVGILVATFAGWGLTKRYSAGMLGDAPVWFRKAWLWSMRLILPLVVAWIGIQYTAVSLANLCENGSAAVWCSTGQSSVAEEPAAPEPGSDATPESGVDEGANVTTSTKASAREDVNQESAAPSDEDILYHSV